MPDLANVPPKDAFSLPLEEEHSEIWIVTSELIKLCNSGIPSVFGSLKEKALMLIYANNKASLFHLTEYNHSSLPHIYHSLFVRIPFGSGN